MQKNTKIYKKKSMERLIMELNCCIFSDIAELTKWFGIEVTPTYSLEEAIREGKKIVKESYREEEVVVRGYYMNGNSYSSSFEYQGIDSIIL